MCVSGWGGSGAGSGDARHTPDGGDTDEAAAADGGGPEVAGARGELLGTDTLIHQTIQACQIHI